MRTALFLFLVICILQGCGVHKAPSATSCTCRIESLIEDDGLKSAAEFVELVGNFAPQTAAGRFLKAYELMADGPGREKFEQEALGDRLKTILAESRSEQFSISQPETEYKRRLEENVAVARLPGTMTISLPGYPSTEHKMVYYIKVIPACLEGTSDVPVIADIRLRILDDTDVKKWREEYPRKD